MSSRCCSFVWEVDCRIAGVLDSKKSWEPVGSFAGAPGSKNCWELVGSFAGAPGSKNCLEPVGRIAGVPSSHTEELRMRSIKLRRQQWWQFQWQES